MLLTSGVWAFTYVNSFLYYEDYDTLDEDTRKIMQESMAAFGGNAPTASPCWTSQHCTKAFVASRPSAVFCSPQCKSKHNVYKSWAKNKNKE